jgi:hypothetical protein
MTMDNFSMRCMSILVTSLVAAENMSECMVMILFSSEVLCSLILIISLMRDNDCCRCLLCSMVNVCIGYITCIRLTWFLLEHGKPTSRCLWTMDPRPHFMACYPLSTLFLNLTRKHPNDTNHSSYAHCIAPIVMGTSPIDIGEYQRQCNYL